jgi:hypothetical protein
VVAAAVIWLVWPRPVSRNPIPPLVQQNTAPAPPAGARAREPAPGEPAAQPAGGQMPADNPSSPLYMLSSKPILGNIGDAAKSPAGQKLAAVFDELAATLGNIHDQASAQAATTNLRGLAPRLDHVAPLIAELPGDSQTRVRTALTNAGPKVQNAVEAIGTVPGVQEHVRPIANQIIQKLEQLGQQSR